MNEWVFRIQKYLIAISIDLIHDLECPQEFGSIQADFGPYGGSSKHEVHQEQQFINGQPVYEKRHERRFEDDRLVHQDGYETGSRSAGLVGHGRPDLGQDGQSFSRSSSSRSSYSSSSGNSDNLFGHGIGTRGRSYNSVSDNNSGDDFNAEVQRLRERLHEGASVIHTPARGTSFREENNQESHFVNGQQVYHKNEERRYEDGRLMHNVNEEGGIRNTGSAEIERGSQSAMGALQTRSRESSSAQENVRAGSDYNSPSHTSYRASYWRPGPRERTVSTRQRQTVSSSSNYVPRADRIRNTNENTGNSDSRQVSNSNSLQRSSSSRVISGSNQPAYRASYTPSRKVVRVPQRQPVVSSPTTASSSESQQYSGAAYRSPASSTRSSSRSEIEASYSNEPLASGTDHQSQHVNENRDIESSRSSSRQQVSTSYGSGSYVQPSASRTSQSSSRITDTYSVPYSIRSPSYQPSRFANYSAWSHWNKDSSGSAYPGNRDSISTHNRYDDSQRQFIHAQGETTQVNSQSGYNTDEAFRTSSSSAENTDQSQHVRALMPGFLYEDHLDQSNDIGHNIHHGNSEQQSSSVQTSQSRDYSSSRPSSTSFSSQQVRQSATVHPGLSYAAESGNRRTSDAAVGATPGGTIGMSFTVNVGEGESVRLNNIDTMASETDQQRYDISPHANGEPNLSEVGNEVETEYSVGSGSSESGSVQSSTYSSQQHRYSSGHNNVPVSGSAYDRSVRVTNRTSNTITAQIQPLVSSYKMETKTSRRYLNGRLVSETKFNKYYENGVLVHENQTERSRDEMITDGINVNAFDLGLDDLASYGVVDNEDVSMAHSQRFDMKQEREFVDGNQVYEATHERRFQDGELVFEDHDEKDANELSALGRTIYNQDDSDIHGAQRTGTSSTGYTQNFIENRNYGRSHDTGTYDGYRSGNRQQTGIGETVTVNVQPVTKVKKTEIRHEQEYRDGQQIYDMRHERQFTDGNLVHEQHSELGPEELGTAGHRDALQDILSGRSLTTVSDSKYRPSTATYVQKQDNSHHQQSSYGSGASTGANMYDSGFQQGNSQTISSHSSQDSSSRAYQGATVEAGGYQEKGGMVGTNLLNSGGLTYVIGGNGIDNFDSVASASSLSEGSRSSVSSSLNDIHRQSEGSRRPGGGYHVSFEPGTSQSSSTIHSTKSQSTYDNSHRGIGSYDQAGSQDYRSGYDQTSSRSDGFGQQSSSISGHSSEISSTQHGSGSRASGYDAFGDFGAFSAGDRPGGASLSHRREMEVEEHYENGQLVRGRSNDREWKNDEILRNDSRVYGEVRRTYCIILSFYPCN